MRRCFLWLLVAGVVLTGCLSRKRPEPETRMFHEFSLGEVVKRIPSAGLEGPSGGTGYTASPGSNARKDFSLTYTIADDADAAFDEGDFIRQLKVETERVADETGLHRDGGGLSGDAFHFHYSDEDHEGWVEVVGTRMEGGRYKVWGVIRERVKDTRQER